jgi:hypothetical protein
LATRKIFSLCGIDAPDSGKLASDYQTNRVLVKPTSPYLTRCFATSCTYAWNNWFGKAVAERMNLEGSLYVSS